MTRRTSRQALAEIEASGLLSRRRLQVFRAVVEHGPATAGELHAHLGGIDKAKVNARLTELRDLGVVIELGERRCRITGCEVIVWDATGDLPRKRRRKPPKPTAAQAFAEVLRIVGEAYGAWEAALERDEAKERLRLGLNLDAPVETFGHARRVEGVLRHLRGAIRLQRDLMLGPGAQVAPRSEQSASSRPEASPAGADGTTASAGGPQTAENGLRPPPGSSPGASSSSGSSSSEHSRPGPRAPAKSPESPISSPPPSSSRPSSEPSTPGSPGGLLFDPGEPQTDLDTEGRRPDGRKR